MPEERSDTDGAGSTRKPRITVLYHYLHPDDVVSARQFDDLCAGLVARGWDLEAMPCNRGCHNDTEIYPQWENWRGVRLRRIWRPRFPQAVPLGRVLNSAWMLGRWSLLGTPLHRNRPDVVLVGTDPAFSVLVGPALKALIPGVKIAHWAHDLYPEAPLADGLLAPDAAVVRVLRRALRGAYASCDLIVDIGACMRETLASYQSAARQLTITPWALTEPSVMPRPDPAVRAQLFGDAAVGVLYSGNFGRAHTYEPFLKLARSLRGSSVHFCFAVRGSKAAELRAAVTPQDVNIRFAGFADEAELQARLAAADIHLASLHSSWTGVVVPSKFFGSLAVGRPVIFAGAQQGAIARWIAEHQVGWVLDDSTSAEVAAHLRLVAERPEELAPIQRRCHRVYGERFAKEGALDRWDAALRELLT